MVDPLMKKIHISKCHALGSCPILVLDQGVDDPFPRFALNLQYENVAYDGIGSYEIPYLVSSNVYKKTDHKIKLVRDDNHGFLNTREAACLLQFLERVDELGIQSARHSFDKDEFEFFYGSACLYKHIFFHGIYGYGSDRIAPVEKSIRGMKDIRIEFSSDIPLDTLAMHYDGYATDIWNFNICTTDLEKQLIQYFVWLIWFMNYRNRRSA